jgi:ATP-dependent exoDNAse (exonuclease V) beta subunit
MTTRTPVRPPRLFPHTVIRASAGSGKTFQLTSRYIALLHRGVPPEKILAVTFTRKAAGEIFDRIVWRLAEAAGSERERKKLASAIGAAELSAKQCIELLTSATQSLHRLRVGTLDSFFSKVAGSCSLELGLPLGWQIVEDLVDRRLRDRAIAESLAGDSIGPVLTLLNLLAKGDVVRAISQLIRDTVDRLYFTARETEEEAWTKLPRYKALSPEVLADCRQQLDDLTFDHKKIMEEIEKDRQFLDENRLVDFIRRGLPSKVLEGAQAYQRKPITDDVRNLYEKLLQHVKSLLVNRLADQNEATFKLLVHFRDHYERLKLTQAALRFDDVTFALSQATASGMADDDRVTFRLDATIDHLLLDEFQDTSLAQWSVLRPIAERVTSSQDGTSFFCVGDTKQAIYGWRGGLTELFDAVETELVDIQPESLTTSYRSSPIVIDVVNRVFSGLDRHKELGEYEEAVKLWQRRFTEHSTSKTDLAGYVSLETGPRVDLDGVDDLDPEAAAKEAFLDFAAERIAEIHRQSPEMSVGVLCRSNKPISGLIYRLRKLGVPASEEGGNPLTDSCAVELILSLLRLADHPGDTAAAYHIARSPLASEFGLTPEQIKQTGFLAAKLRRELIEKDYGPAVAHWAQLLAPSCDERDRSRLQQLVELAYAYQPGSTLRPAEFVEFIEGQKVADPTTAAIRVMTVHLAKGLEFDIVVLPELDSGRNLIGMPPTVVTSRDKLGGSIDCVCRYTNEHEQKLLPKSFQEMFTAAINSHIGEALCVMYVAMTRAIHALHMLIEPSRENERQLPKTFAGLLRAALCDEGASATGLLYQHGRADWYTTIVGQSHALSVDENATKDEGQSMALFHQIALAPPLAERRRGLDRQNPSRMKTGPAALRRALEIIDPQHNKAMLRGTIMHAWFEQIAWLDEGVPSAEQLLASLARVRGAETVDDKLRRKWLGEFHEMLRKPDVTAVLTRSTYIKSVGKDVQVKAVNEWPFAAIKEGRLISGRIDRVVFHERNGLRFAAGVLDFKTDAVADKPGERLDDLIEEYRPQIAEYKDTVVQQTGLAKEKVSGALLFVGEGVLARL